MNVGIAGASGYTGEELITLLAQHPKVNLAAVASRSLAGTRVGAQFPRLGATRAGKLVFAHSTPSGLAGNRDIDTWFLALPHGTAAEYARPLLEAEKKVIDLSADFRLGDPDLYADYYGREHPDPDLLVKTPYVIPELMTEKDWTRSALIACPGCYPTGIQVLLVPLLRANLISGEGIIINSYSAVSGAGRKLEDTYLFCERAESLKPYGLVRHRHLSEIEEQLSRAAGKTVIVQFSPHLAPLRRGIMTTIVCPASEVATEEAVTREWERHYHNRDCIQILPSGNNPDTATVAGTNRADIAVHRDPRTRNLILTSAIDNLLKGAAGQAVQIMNCQEGWEETTGLPLA